MLSILIDVLARVNGLLLLRQVKRTRQKQPRAQSPPQPPEQPRQHIAASVLIRTDSGTYHMARVVYSGEELAAFSAALQLEFIKRGEYVRHVSYHAVTLTNALLYNETR